ncbi:MAG TPA: ATP-binding protein [Thermoplasmata archaeon]|nr:ATP-binding protein [Thermoplasmata archaeon]
MSNAMGSGGAGTTPAGLGGRQLKGGTAWRYLAGTVLTAVLVGLAIWALTSRTCEELRSESRIKVASIAATIAAGIPAEDHQTLHSREDERLLAYQRLLAHIVSARQANAGVERVYTLSRDPAGKRWHYVLESGTDVGASTRARVGDGFNALAKPELSGALSSPTADRGPTGNKSGAVITGYAPIRDRSGATQAVVAVDVKADAALAAERRFRAGAQVAYAVALLGIALVGWTGYRRRLQEIERTRNVQMRLNIHRLTEVMTRTGSEADLVKSALEVIADGTGYAHWALYKRNRERGTLELFATRGLPEDAGADLVVDSVDMAARSPASRAAFRGEAVIARDQSEVPPYGFAARCPGLGPDVVVAAMPLTDQGETTAVIQCLAPRAHGFHPEDITLIRWMASQLALGLKRIQLELRDQLLASYMQSTQEILVGFDLDGVITYANPAAERALGSPKNRELQGKSVDEHFSPSEGGGGASFLSVVRATETYAGDVTCHRHDGSTFPAEVTASKALDRDGSVSTIVLFGRDVTERRDHEEELKSRSEQLLLINEQLQHANAKFASTNRMKNEFLANTSHELRTPLNAVIGFASLIEQGATELEEERRSFARSIRESAEHLLKVINDILDVARVEAGRLEVELENGDAAPCILSTMDILRASAVRKGLRLLTDTGPDPLNMELDPARMRQILLNLVGNAIKFTDKGEVRVKAWREPERSEIRIAIEDTGIGISKEQLPRIFVRFSQVDGSYKRRHGGTGLGLVITQSLVERMGGRIAIFSEGLGMGTRITLAFPISPARASGSAEAGANAGGPAEAARPSELDLIPPESPTAGRRET